MYKLEQFGSYRGSSLLLLFRTNSEKANNKKMDQKQKSPSKSLEVFISFKKLLEVAGFHENGLRCRYITIPNIVLFLNLTLPMALYVILGFWLYWELNFDPKLISQSFTISVCGIQAISIYSCLLINKATVLGAIDHLCIVVEQSRVFSLKFVIDSFMCHKKESSSNQ